MRFVSIALSVHFSRVCDFSPPSLLLFPFCPLSFCSLFESPMKERSRHSILPGNAFRQIRGTRIAEQSARENRASIRSRGITGGRPRRGAKISSAFSRLISAVKRETSRTLSKFRLFPRCRIIRERSRLYTIPGRNYRSPNYSPLTSRPRLIAVR